MKRLILALVLVGAFVFGFAWERSEQKAHSPGSGASRRPRRGGMIFVWWQAGLV
jgi:hypothetical protein